MNMYTFLYICKLPLCVYKQPQILTQKKGLKRKFSVDTNEKAMPAVGRKMLFTNFPLSRPAVKVIKIYIA